MAETPQLPWIHSTWAHLMFLVVVVGGTFSLTANYSLDGNVDTIAAALPAWKIATQADLTLDEYAGLNPWLVDSPHGVVSNRTPGVIAVALPAYLLAQPSRFTAAPATATAVVITTAAMLIIYLVLRRLIKPVPALVAVLALALGTSTWQISARELWPHGPGQLFVAITLLGLSRRRPIQTGLSMAAALLVRPVTAVMAAFVAVSEAWRSRRLLPIISIGLSIAFGAALLLLYNTVVFGLPTFSGGYPDVFAERLTAAPDASYMGNLWSMFFSSTNGLLVISPILLAVLPYAVAAWRVAPRWTQGAALASVAYLLIHAKLNRASGGMLFGYRYPLEAVTMAAPLLALGGLILWRKGFLGRAVVATSVLVSVAIQVALLRDPTCWQPDPLINVCTLF